MPFNLIAIFYMAWNLKGYFASLAVPEMNRSIVATSDEKRILEGALYGVNLSFQVRRPANPFSNLPEQSFTRARTHQ